MLPSMGLQSWTQLSDSATILSIQLVSPTFYKANGFLVMEYVSSSIIHGCELF